MKQRENAAENANKMKKSRINYKISRKIFDV